MKRKGLFKPLTSKRRSVDLRLGRTTMPSFISTYQIRHASGSTDTLSSDNQKTKFTKYCAKLESKRLEELNEELFPEELNERMVKLPELQYIYHVEGTYPLSYPRNRVQQPKTRRRSPPTLKELLRTSRAGRRANISDIHFIR